MVKTSSHMMRKVFLRKVLLHSVGPSILPQEDDWAEELSNPEAKNFFGMLKAVETPLKHLPPDNHMVEDWFATQKLISGLGLPKEDSEITEYKFCGSHRYKICKKKRGKRRKLEPKRSMKTMYRTVVDKSSMFITDDVILIGKFVGVLPTMSVGR
ncbi:hypothetical protein M9H77_27151 [Catharanthus roseus]|uniref:Uncharacterized protein n=1 Tax=Catharanthus roseus TaxID=4058 RepID=A0ACC0AFY8_CATRO|nr:hypothetical protein M9H77_27151 [Catharanthus roseus]